MRVKGNGHDKALGKVHTRASSEMRTRAIGEEGARVTSKKMPLLLVVSVGKDGEGRKWRELFTLEVETDSGPSLQATLEKDRKLKLRIS